MSKARVLVIDDDPLLTKTLGKVLTKKGYEVDTAKNGHEGIEKAKSGFYHLILCDIRMPGLDGLMTIRHIQDFQEKAGAGKSGFIVITAYGNDETKHQAFQLGVTDFISKPFDLQPFLKVIQESTAALVKETSPEEVKRINQKLDAMINRMVKKHL